jgi:LuxR family maltose regulon positive regulatory protein
MEGWVAGLRMAALNLRAAPVSSARWTSPTAIDDVATPFMADQVLAQQDAEARDFLVRTSVLDEMCDALCQAVSAPSGSHREGQSFLEWLAKRGVFLTRMEKAGAWYRYHHAFRALLQQQLRLQCSADEISEMHRRASEWYERNGLLDAALEYALRAGDSRDVETLVRRHRIQLMNEDQWQWLERWLGQLPRSVVDASPELLVTEAAVAFSQFRKADLSRLLDRAESLITALPQSPEHEALRGEIAGLRTCTLGDLPDFSACAQSAHLALRTAPHDRRLARALAWLHASLGRLIRGEYMAAFEMMYSSLSAERCEGPTCRARLLAMAAYLHAYAGDLPALQRVASEVLTIDDIPEHGATRNWARHHLGVVHYQRNDLAAAEDLLSTVIAERHQAFPDCVVQSAIALALTYQAQGRPQAARQSADLAAQHVRDMRCPSLLPVVDAFQAQLAVQQGRVAEAVERVAQAPVPEALGFASSFFNPHLAVIRVWLASEAPEHRAKAAQALERHRAHAEAAHNTAVLTQLLALEALHAKGNGNQVAALAALERALVLAQPGNDVRLFADLGDPITDLLAHLHSLRIDSGYVHRIRRAAAATRQPLGPSDSTEHVEVLSEREMQVLMLLWRQLSDKEIAATLAISTSTVKSRTRSIFEKLRVNRRRAAIAQAIALGLLIER